MRPLLLAVLALLAAAPATYAGSTDGRLSPAAWDAIQSLRQDDGQMGPGDAGHPRRAERALCGERFTRPADFQVVLVGRICRANAVGSSWIVRSTLCLRKAGHPDRLTACLSRSFRHVVPELRAVVELDARLASLVGGRCAAIIVRGDQKYELMARRTERLVDTLDRGRGNPAAAVMRWARAVDDAGSSGEAEATGPELRRTCAPRT
jgi:hypothetical protein